MCLPRTQYAESICILSENRKLRETSTSLREEQLHVRDSPLWFMQQVRGQIYGQLGYGKFLPGYFEYAG